MGYSKTFFIPEAKGLSSSISQSPAFSEDDQNILIETLSCNLQCLFRTNYYSVENSYGVTAASLYFSSFLLRLADIYVYHFPFELLCIILFYSKLFP